MLARAQQFARTPLLQTRAGHLEAENMDDLINGTPYLIVLFGSILLFIGIILTMNHLTSQKQQ